MNLAKKTSFIVYILFGASILSLLIWAFIPQPFPVETSIVKRGYYSEFIEDDAKTRAKNIYTITAPVTGTLLRIHQLEGDWISKGETVAVIEPVTASLLDLRTKQELEQDLGAAEAELQALNEEIERTKAALQNAQTDLKRNRDLIKNKYLSQKELEQSELLEQFRRKEYEGAKFKFDAVQHKIGKIKTSLKQVQYAPNTINNKIDIPSPIDGRIIRIYQKSEATVFSGTKLLAIADPTQLEIVADILSPDAAKISPKAKVIIERWGGIKPLEGKVRSIEPSGFTKLSALGIEEQRVNVIIDITSPQSEWKNIGDAYQVDVKIMILESNNILTIPVSAIYRDENHWAVFVLSHGRAQKRLINIRSQNPEHVAIEAGLSEGEEVILYPSNQIQEGLRVKKR